MENSLFPVFFIIEPSPFFDKKRKKSYRTLAFFGFGIYCIDKK